MLTKYNECAAFKHISNNVCHQFKKLCSRYGEMMRGKRENFFSREKKPNVGFVILAPLSRHSLGDGGSHPFKKSEKTFLFTFTYLCREQSHLKKISQKLGQYHYFCRSLKVSGVKVDLSCFLDAGSTVMYFHFEKPKSWWRKFWSQWCLSCHESGIPSRIHTQSSLMI